MTDLRISHSEISCFKACRRKWLLGYVWNWGLSKEETIPTGVRPLGLRIHKALEMRYIEGANSVEVLRRIYAEDIAAWPEAADDLRKEQDLAVLMLEGYEQWVQETGADEGLKLVAAETPIEVDSGIEGVKLRGKLDMRMQREVDHARVFVDHKTMGEFTSASRLLPIDEQMKFYCLLEYLDSLDKTGDEPVETTDGGIYNMLRRVKRTAKATPPFYDRIEIRHNRETLRSMWLRVRRVIEEMLEIRQAIEAGGDHRYWAYPRPSRDCLWSCDFLPVCPMMDDGSDWPGMLQEHYVHVDPYERYNRERDGVTE